MQSWNDADDAGKDLRKDVSAQLEARERKEKEMLMMISVSSEKKERKKVFLYSYSLPLKAADSFRDWMALAATYVSLETLEYYY